MSDPKKMGATAVVGIMAIFLITQVSFIINPAMATLAAEYSEIPYETFIYIGTIATVGQTLFSYVSGPLAGIKVKYKTLLTISILLVIVGALIPTFVHSFPLLCVARFLAGAGVGLMSPLGAPIIMRTFEGKKAASLMGISGTVTNAAGVVYQYVSGVLCTININAMWYFHLVLLIPLILILLFMPEPDKIEAPSKEAEKDPNAPKTKIGIRAWLIIIGYGLMFMSFYPFMLNISQVLATEGIGDAATAGLILSAYSVGGIASIIMGPIYNRIQGRTLALGIILEAIGMAVAAYASSSVLLILGMFLCGVAIFILMNASLMDVGKDLAPAQMNKFSSYFIVGLSLGGVLGAPFINICSKINPYIRFSITAGFYCTVIIAVIWVVLNFVFAKKNAAVNA